MDVSADMLERSAKRTAQWADRITLLEQPYGEENLSFQGKFDLILFSYSLTMINPQWATLIAQAKQDLKPGGSHCSGGFDSPFPWFKRHMARNHVRMEGHLLPVLENLFLPAKVNIKNAYAGVWQYLIYIGRVGE